MFKFKEKLSTKNKSQWVNTCEYIILHHTATKEWSIKGVINTLTGINWSQVSAHFLIDTNGDAYKIGDPKDILWHAWVSSWWKLKDMNNYSIGIEVIGPLSDWWFTKEQKIMTKRLVQHLMWAFKIPMEHVLRHRDIAPKRKVDIADTFWNDKYITFAQWCWTLKPQEVK